MSHSGRELFFRTDDNHIMAAAYTVKGDPFVTDKPRVWSERTVASSGAAGTNYDVASDGKRIAALMPVEASDTKQAQTHVIFPENFLDEVRRRVPTAR